MQPVAELFDLTSRSAIVTGGSKGLGRSIAGALSSAGAEVLITSRHPDEVEAAARELSQETGGSVTGVRSDVSREEDVEEMAALALDRWGKIDILVNNAGINIRGFIEELSLADFRSVHKVNTEGVWLACKAVVPSMKKRRYGRIINVSSAQGVVGLARRSPYNSSKGAVVLLTRTLAAELAPYGITCNAICPGPFPTPMNESIVESGEFQDFVRANIPMQRAGKPGEICGPAVFLASEASSYVTASLLCVDGGWTGASVLPATDD